MPDIRQHELTQVSYCLGIIIEAVNNYHIRSLLIDCSNSVVEVEDRTYNAIATKFATALRATRLKKLAWVIAPKARLYSALRQELSPPIKLVGFSGKAEAMEWLLQLEPA
ncbi:hypothetical protein DXT99_08140 [Pontibacter diazotrophicus]|uniref:STAS/SEC14 domain-containing protein n=2 Tax=Pontibacter diazotrophicus TaxID=1400979 RepID=A0A3D8LDH3_9BACT|nr:hypothetical protein DXT99_08140 [Pontibacter diazotrophicus]